MGRTLYIKIRQVNNYRLLLSPYFLSSMSESRSVASLLQSGMSIPALANVFHNMVLLLSGLSSNQPPEKRGKKNNAEKKGKQIGYMKKRKETESSKTPGCEQPGVMSVCG